MRVQPPSRRFGTTLLLVTVFAGCAGKIDDPDPFHAARASGPASCPDVPALLARNCSAEICHDADEPSGDLDLATPGVEGRLAGVQASDVVCSDRVLVDEDKLSRSFLLEKLEDPFPQCGDPMPLTGVLEPYEVQCVRRWVEATFGGRADAGTLGDAAPPGDAGGG